MMSLGPVNDRNDGNDIMFTYVEPKQKQIKPGRPKQSKSSHKAMQEARRQEAESLYESEAEPDSGGRRRKAKSRAALDYHIADKFVEDSRGLGGPRLDNRGW